MAVAVLILAVSFLIPLSLFSRTLHERTRIRHLTRHGVKADAVLLNMKQTGVFINQYPQMQLKMQVFSKGKNFVTEVCEVFRPSDIQQLQVGNFIEIKYNPVNTKEVILVRV